jgi:hypothetical protein
MSMDMGTSSMDMGTSSGASAKFVPNSVVLDLRKQRGWGRPRLAKEMHNFCLAQRWPSPGEENLSKQIYRIESGRVRAPDEFYMRLYCQFFGKSAHELFGRIGSTESQSPRYKIRSHKFIPAYVGVRGAGAVQAAYSMESAPEQWSQCHRVCVGGDDVSCHLYAWPFGVAMYHLVEELEPESVAEVSVWRRMSYRENIAWAGTRFEEMISAELPDEPYVLSTYWVEATPWDGSRLETSLRLLSIPRTLIERDDDNRVPSQGHALLVEQELLREGFNHPEIVEFGIKGISIGYASWSGVVYHPLAPDRALAEDEIVRCELAAQSIWAYCNYIRQEVEAGRDPLVPAEYGWRFLRGIRSRLTTERPQETSQHRSMRDAIVETSGLARHLAQAVETLREVDGGSA